MAENPGYELDDRTSEGNNPDDAEQESTFSTPGPSAQLPSTQGQQQGHGDTIATESAGMTLFKARVDTLYTMLRDELNYLPNATHYDLFFERDGQLFIREIKQGGSTYKEKQLTKNNGQFPTIGVLTANLGKGRMIAMGFTDNVTPNKSIKTRAGNLALEVDFTVLNNVQGKGDKGGGSFEITSETVDSIQNFGHDVEGLVDTSFAGIDGDEAVDMRKIKLEIENLQNNIKKLKDEIIPYDSGIITKEGLLKELKKQKAGVKRGNDIAGLEKEIAELKQKRKDALDAHGLLSSEIFKNLKEIRAELMKIAGDDTFLLEKLKILFKEQGLTIASIVSAVGLLISTIVLAVTGGAAGGAGAAGGSASGKGFVQKQLERLGKFLKYLAGKAGAALPGIIGSVVSFFLRVVATVIEHVARHLYMAIAAVVAFVVAYVGGRGKTRRS